MSHTKFVALLTLVLTSCLAHLEGGAVWAADAKEPVVVDLAPFRAGIEKSLDDSIAKFRREHPEAVVSLLVLDYAGFNPYLTIHADTQANSDATVKKYPDSAGKDEHGRFNDSPADAKFPLGDFRFKGFPDLYALNLPLSLKYPDGKIVAFDLERLGDEAMNQAMVEFLVPILEKHKGYLSLKREPVFRLGVHAENSRHAKFWRVKE